MHEYIFDAELVRLALAFGVVISMLFYEQYGVTTGGIIVPGYLALFVTRPTHIAATLVIAVAIYWLVQKRLRPRWMLWGRRLFETEILVALIFQGAWLAALFALAPAEGGLALLYSVGFLLPGIVAHDMGRQGVRTTLVAAAGSALVVFGLITLVGALRDIWGLPTGAIGLLPPSAAEPLAYPETWLLVGVVVSVLASIVLHRRGLFHRALVTDSLRTGGFVTGAYLALFANKPADLGFVLLCTTLTYLIVTQVLMKQAILFGRTKLAAMFLTGIVVTWLGEIAIGWSGIDYVPWYGFNAIVPTVAALLANDAERQGPWRTLAGAIVSTLLVLVAVVLLYGAYSWLTTGRPALP
ncbi:MAG TPA: poly-gamma-glutamate biosynthesis protein PgsC/CapC [Anaerolineae bacterium]|nr:poly-gamma-glutamate biosynthesis protein PgsC/CapC [Anaerolineae bacterium]